MNWNERYAQGETLCDTKCGRGIITQCDDVTVVGCRGVGVACASVL